MEKTYGVDLRSAAAFRIILSFYIALQFVFTVLGNFNEIYSPETGVLGNAFAEDYHTYYKGFIGIFCVKSDVTMRIFIWTIIAVMILLAVGFYTRIMALIGCVLLSLFFNRYSLLYFGWEMYASVFLFWLIIIPPDSFFTLFKINKIPVYKRSSEIVINRHSSASINSTDKNTVKNFEWRSPLSIALIFQIGIIYFYNGISKNGDLWMNGNAIESFLAETDKTRAMGYWLAKQYTLTGFLNYITLIIEIGLIFLLFLPWKSKVLRYWASFLIFALHWGIDVFVDVGNFKYVATAVAVLVLPGDVWNKIYNNLYGNNKFKAAKVLSSIALPGLKVSINPITQKALACALCFIIIFSNLSQTNASRTNDRMKQVIQLLHIDGLLNTENNLLLPQYSFFTQYWHLYSPDPPKEKGFMQVEVITENNDTIPVFNGLPLNGKRFYSKVQHNLFTYLALKKGRNQKEKIAEKYLVLREIRMWNKQQGHPRLKILQLVIYSNLFDQDRKSKFPFERIVYKSVDVKYRKTM